jgi:flagellar basal-body rod modification protein FlgD
MGFISPVATDASGNARKTGSQQTLGKDDFLQLMVTKLQYQDPLKPMEDESFIAQLAQFSSLEQMSNIADGIETSNQWDYLQMQSMNNVMASGFIGKEVTADYSGLYFDGSTKPSISYTSTVSAKEIQFVIKDAEGNVMTTLTQKNVAAGAGKITWDGKDDSGNRVDVGYYTITATATDSAGKQFTPDLTLKGVVTKVVYRDGAAYLVVNGTELAMGDVVSIAAPESSGNTEET